MGKTIRFLIITALSGLIFACGSYHYSLYKKRGPDKPVVTADKVPIEKIPTSFSGTGTLDIKGVSYTIKKEFEEAPVYAAKERIIRQNKAEGNKPVDAKSDKVPSFLVKEKNFDFICFVTPKNHVRGYVFDATPSGTAITSLEGDLKEITSLKAYGKVSEQEIPPEYLKIMPSIPDFYIKGGTENSSDIYSCFPAGDEDAEISEIKRRLAINSWQTENWDDILKLADAGKKDRLLVARKNDLMCHIMTNRESGRLVVSFRFSKVRNPQIAY
ncbi:MAG TPA: hypothetical protein DCZ94_08135 [Lentisphaeria bacterium]|nr:MAG: hypothetical protein A2X48_19610 [Lentisphaerae bacterium GWF2_49_21]HBC86907.1 hypothetical protein [Lentisphaeria bacterium]